MNLHADPTRITIQDCVIPNAGLDTMVLGLFAGNRAMALDATMAPFVPNPSHTDEVLEDRHAPGVQDALDAHGEDALDVPVALAAQPSTVKSTSRRTARSATKNAKTDFTTSDAAYALQTARKE